MLDRQTLTVSGALTGLGMVCLGALIFGSPGSASGTLDGLQGRLVSVRISGSATTAPASDFASRLLANPLFGAGSGHGAALRVDGLSILPGRKAALISIDGKPSDWLELGGTRDDVTLMDVQPTMITVDTDAGIKELSVGSGSQGLTPPVQNSSASFSPAAQPVVSTPLRPTPAPSAVPAGVRLNSGGASPPGR